MGTPAAFITSLANALLPSSSAADFDGPNTAKPCARKISATPATSGASGPITIKSAVNSFANASTESASFGETGEVRAIFAIPGLPGAQTTSTFLSLSSVWVIACSLAP